MNSRETVARTLAWDGPARVAQSFDPADFVWAFPEIPHGDGDWRWDPEHGWRRRDEWGNLLRRLRTMKLPGAPSPSRQTNGTSAASTG